MRENDEWKTYCQTIIDPIIELEKGKLLQNNETENSGSNDSSNCNLFDDEFMRSDFAVNGDDNGESGDVKEEKVFDEAKDGDEEDH